MAGWIKRGLMAGAAGTTARSAVTLLDRALRGRPEDRTPEQALAGIGSGLGVGVVMSGLRTAGLRLPGPLGAAASGALAMIGQVTPTDWVADAVPQLAYGVATHAVITAAEPAPGSPDAPVKPGFALTARSFTLGVAAGMRSTLGLAGPALTGGASGLRRLVPVAGVAGEIVVDKLPFTPSRLEPPGLYGRFLAGAGGAAALARREHAAPAWPVIAGCAGAALGTYGGAAWRAASVKQRADWHGAVAEDLVALALAALACARR
jgi:hypothetical protein